MKIKLKLHECFQLNSDLIQKATRYLGPISPICRGLQSVYSKPTNRTLNMSVFYSGVWIGNEEKKENKLKINLRNAKTLRRPRQEVEQHRHRKNIRSHLSRTPLTKGLSYTLLLAGSTPVLPTQHTLHVGCVCC